MKWSSSVRYWNSAMRFNMCFMKIGNESTESTLDAVPTAGLNISTVRINGESCVSLAELVSRLGFWYIVIISNERSSFEGLYENRKNFNIGVAKISRERGYCTSVLL